MSTQRYVSRATKVAARMIGGEMMIMSGADSSLFSLNETASILWQAADGVTPLAQIVERHICAEYEVEPEVALRDAEELAEELAQRGILQVSEVPVADGGHGSPRFARDDEGAFRDDQDAVIASVAKQSMPEGAVIASPSTGSGQAAAKQSRGLGSP